MSNTPPPIWHHLPTETLAEHLGVDAPCSFSELKPLALQSQQTEAELALQENQHNAVLDFQMLGSQRHRLW